jgi:tRNA(Ile)-lysidine synthase
MPKKKAVSKTVVPRRGELAQKLLEQLRRHHSVSPGQRIGVAVSGGADSVALLRLFLELRKQLGIVLSVVHFNHKLRGKASDADERFVRKLAAQQDLEFFVEREDIAAKSRRERTNLEEAARRSRYAFFERLAAEGRFDLVAVAHTADDQAETVLGHILRGTGIAGLGGIHPQAGCVFRPLIKMRRGELREYLRARRQTWREDASNRDIKRTRARIRHKLMPLLEKQFQAAVVEHLCQLAELAREDDAWLESSAELRVFLSAKEEKGEWRIQLRDLGAPEAGRGEPGSAETAWSRQSTEAMSKRIIRVLVKKAKPRSGQLSAVHVEAVLHLAQQPDSGKSLHLPGGVEVRRERDFLVFRPRDGATSSASISKPYAYALDLRASPTDLRIVEQSCSLRFTVIDWPSQGRENSVTGAVLDRECLRLPLVVRNWRPGDSMQPLGHQKRHKLSRLLNEVGVSRWEKASWPVLTSGGKIAWTRGLPVASEFAAGGATRTGVVLTEVSQK